jgi:hypothetical protein
MRQLFSFLKTLLPGEWEGEGFARFPTIENTGYREQWMFTADPDKDAIHFNQHTSYNNDTANNGHTVFWDTGFILLNKEEKILLVSAQVGGRVETYQLQSSAAGDKLVFDSIDIENDPKTIRSQRVLHIIGEDTLQYELNMSTHQALEFQNHLAASLKKVK